jgi:hypothetical protein
LIGVVDRIGEVEHRSAVGTQDDEIFKHRVLEADCATDEIVESSDSGVGNPKANDMTIAGTQSTFSTESVVSGGATTSFGSSLDLIGCAGTPIRGTVSKEGLDCGEVHRPTF